MPQQQYNQIPYPAQNQPVQPPPQNTGNMQIMYDANGNQVYVQLMYDRTGKPVYVQMMPKIVGRDAAGKPVYNMVPVGQVIPSQQMQSQQMQSQQMQSQQMQSQQMQSQQMQSQQMQPQQRYPQQMPPASGENTQFSPQNNVKPPPVPVLPRPGEQPEQPAVSVPDRPAIRASSLASAMYTAAQQQQNVQGTGSFFARMQQQKQMQAGYGQQPMNAQELLREDARTAFVPQARLSQEPPDETTVLKKIFESKQKEYQMNTGNGNSTFAVDVPADEVKSVSEKNLYQNSEKPVSRSPVSKPVRKSEPPPPPAPEPPPEPKESKSEGLKFFRSKKNKEKPKHKTIIVDPDEIFGDSKKHKVEMLGVSIDGDDKAVDDKIREMKYGGKKSRRSMIDAEVTLESMADDPLARKALTEEVVQQAYDSIESAEIAKALEQLNQGIFPKSTKD